MGDIYVHKLEDLMLLPKLVYRLHTIPRKMPFCRIGKADSKIYRELQGTQEAFNKKKFGDSNFQFQNFQQSYTNQKIAVLV